MTSKLVVNTIEADTGISSVSFASSISMNSTAKFHFSAAGIDIGADTNINRPEAGVLGFNISGNEKVRIRSDGKVGIGTDMAGAPASNYGFGFYRATGTGYLYTETGQSGASAGLRAKAGTSDFTIFTTQGVGQLAVYDNTNSAERLHITAAGKVGVNCTPSGMFEVQKNGVPAIIANYNNSKHIQMGAGGSGAGFHLTAGNFFTINHQPYADRGTDNNLTERLRITSGGNLALGNSNAAKKVHISTTGNQKVLIDPNYNNNSGGSSNAEANANNIVESILIRTSFGENAATQTNAGHKWGIKFQGYNGNDFTQAISKCAGVFAVSEDEAGGYNRNVGLAFHTSPYNTNHREAMRINTNGIVTKPYQYVFTVSTTNHSKTANWSHVTNMSPVAAQCTNVSDGSNWSNSTQRFTAPVAGVYHFFVGGWSYGNSNGSRYAYCFKHTNGNNYTFISGGDYCSGDSPMAGWSRTIKLSAGEWVELWGYSAIAIRWGGGHHFYWGGYLLG